MTPEHTITDRVCTCGYHGRTVHDRARHLDKWNHSRLRNETPATMGESRTRRRQRLDLASAIRRAVATKFGA